MTKIVFIGGGSAKFIREVVVDLFSFPALQDACITLMDIDAERVDRSKRLVQKIIADQKLPARVEATTDQRTALDGADYVIITVMVGGYEHYRTDVEIPARYGVFQAVSDTIGPGGVFRTVRTAPVLRQIADDLRELAPHAWVLNYANPMAMNILTLSLCGQERVVGLCHSIQGAYHAVAGWLGIPPDEITYTAAGINHINFYLRLEHNGRDLYPDLLAQADRIVAEHPLERARMENVRYLGYFAAEGPYHQSEYYPWFRKDQARVDHYGPETAWGYTFDSAMFHSRAAEIEAQISGDLPIRYERSTEYGAGIIHALDTGGLYKFYGNVPNRGLIDNLPPGAIVEVPCVADETGLLPCRMGPVPLPLASVMRPHISVHEMAVQGALTRDKTLIRQAIQADPLTGTVLTLPQIAQMVDELFEANQDYTVGW